MKDLVTKIYESIGEEYCYCIWYATRSDEQYSKSFISSFKRVKSTLEKLNFCKCIRVHVIPIENFDQYKKLAKKKHLSGKDWDQLEDLSEDKYFRTSTDGKDNLEEFLNKYDKK